MIQTVILSERIVKIKKKDNNDNSKGKRADPDEAACYEPPIWIYTQSKFIDCSFEFLTLKAPITTTADDIHKYFFIFISEKIKLDISCETSAGQRIYMKLQALFSLKNKSKKIKVSSAAIFVWRFKG